jgi:hypothetical protein
MLLFVVTIRRSLCLLLMPRVLNRPRGFLFLGSMRRERTTNSAAVATPLAYRIDDIGVDRDKTTADHGFAAVPERCPSRLWPYAGGRFSLHTSRRRQRQSATK